MGESEIPDPQAVEKQKTKHLDRDLEKLKDIIRDYAVNALKARDFNADLPILSTLGAEDYDKIDSMDALQIHLETALRKFVKDWKTLDKQKINYLMKYGIVQEVMKVEERKAIRREMANKPQKTSPKTQRKNNNDDIQNVQNSDIKNKAYKSDRKETDLSSIKKTDTKPYVTTQLQT